MDFITTNGIVLSETLYNEADKILCVFTDNFGIIKVVAKGAKSLKRKDLSGINMFCYGEYILTKRNDMYNVRECNIIAHFFEIRKSLPSLTIGCYVLECIRLCGNENEPDLELLRLALNTLYAIANKKSSNFVIKSAFEFKLCQIMGYTPIYENYQSQKYIYFNIYENELLFSDIPFAKSEEMIQITLSVFLSMDFIIKAPINSFLSFKLSENEQEIFSQVCEKYLLKHLEQTPKTLKQLKIL